MLHLWFFTVYLMHICVSHPSVLVLLDLKLSFCNTTPPTRRSPERHRERASFTAGYPGLVQWEAHKHKWVFADGIKKGQVMRNIFCLVSPSFLPSIFYLDFYMVPSDCGVGPWRSLESSLGEKGKLCQETCSPGCLPGACLWVGCVLWAVLWRWWALYNSLRGIVAFWTRYQWPSLMAFVIGISNIKFIFS